MTIKSTNFNFDKNQKLYKGKVRDVYDVKDKIIMVATDRISAFDHVLNEAIPYKGQVLNQLSEFFLKATSEVVPNWLEAVPDPNVSAGKKCEPIRLEMVIRGYLVGHAWRTYKSGEKTICGVSMPDGMKEFEKFPSPIITPSFKAMEGHDEDISKEEILEQKLISAEDYAILEDYTYKLFDYGTKMALDRGLLLVDTKYEFGYFNGEIVLIDEIHTPDSSRYFYAEGYEDKLANNEAPKQLSKEFVREWLMDHGFQGKEGQLLPSLPREFVELVSERYIELYERMTGLRFARAYSPDIQKRIEDNIVLYLNTI